MSEIKQVWEKAVDHEVMKAATEDWEEYSPSVQSIIETEAKNRGLWDKVLYLRGEKPACPISPEGNLEGYICEGCKGTQFNPYIGRCAKCNLPPEDFGYCRICDMFFSILPGCLCPNDTKKLSRYKAAMTLRRMGNEIFDAMILRILVFPIFFSVGYASVFLGLVGPDFWEEVGPFVEWIIGLSYVFLYYFIFESIWQRTPAKFITGTKVITSVGSKPTLGTIAKRTLIRFIPFEAFSFLGEKVYGWHDRWSGTYVIKAKR